MRAIMIGLLTLACSSEAGQAVQYVDPHDDGGAPSAYEARRSLGRACGNDPMACDGLEAYFLYELGANQASQSANQGFCNPNPWGQDTRFSVPRCTFQCEGSESAAPNVLCAELYGVCEQPDTLVGPLCVLPP